MSTTETIESAHEEWDYRYVEGSFGQNFATSIPCQLRFTSEPSQDTERFHIALEDRGYSPLDTNPDRKRPEGETWYNGEVCSQEHYNRLKVRVFRGNIVRLYPHDDYVPDHHELENLIGAIEVGFSAELEHSPIEDD